MTPFFSLNGDFRGFGFGLGLGVFFGQQTENGPTPEVEEYYTFDDTGGFTHDDSGGFTHEDI